MFILRAFADDDVPGPDDPLEHLRVVEQTLLEPFGAQLAVRASALVPETVLMRHLASVAGRGAFVLPDVS